MLATDVLIAHHDVLRALLREVAQTSGHPAAERRRVLRRLTAELSMHEQIEDEIFYPAVADLSALVAPAHAEHRQLEDQLAVVLRIGPAAERFDEEFAVLAAALEHHAGKEEATMFTEVAAKMDDAALEQIGARLTARLHHLQASRLTQVRLRLKYQVSSQL